jgi:hypothetical protein
VIRLKKRWRYSSVLLEMVRFWFYFYTLRIPVSEKTTSVGGNSYYFGVTQMQAPHVEEIKIEGF